MEVTGSLSEREVTTVSVNENRKVAMFFLRIVTRVTVGMFTATTGGPRALVCIMHRIYKFLVQLHYVVAWDIVANRKCKRRFH